MTLKQQHAPINNPLADGDIVDIYFFDNALKELPITTLFTTVNDGEQQINYLSENLEYLPVVPFCDLNMPQKNSFECLSEIRENERLKNIYMVIFSMFYPQDKTLNWA